MNAKNLIELNNLIDETYSIVSKASANTSYTQWDCSDDVIKTFYTIKNKLTSCENHQAIIDELVLLFAPTGSLQDLSINDGWGYEYIRLSSLFDEIIKRIV